MKYRLEWERRAEKEFSKLDKFAQKQIQKYMNEIVESENPRQQGYGLKYELSGLWRYDIGAYRVLCEIEDELLLVVAVRVGHRKNIYK
jgi:mRNA interferase RelE/StbE